MRWVLVPPTFCFVRAMCTLADKVSVSHMVNRFVHENHRGEPNTWLYKGCSSTLLLWYSSWKIDLYTAGLLDALGFVTPHQGLAAPRHDLSDIIVRYPRMNVLQHCLLNPEFVMADQVPQLSCVAMSSCEASCCFLMSDCDNCGCSWCKHSFTCKL